MHHQFTRGVIGGYLTPPTSHYNVLTICYHIISGGANDFGDL